MLLANTTLTGFCTSTATMLRFVGYAILIFKVAIPIIIIVLGMMDFGKAVVSEKDEDIKKQAVKLGRRALAGLIIFFIPTVINWLFSTVPGATNGDLAICRECLLNATSDTCKDAIGE